MTESEKYEALEGFLEGLGEKQTVPVEEVQSFIDDHKGAICLEDVLDFLAANAVTVLGLPRDEPPRHYRKDDPMWLYIKEVGKVRILGKERELEVATKLQKSLHVIRSIIPKSTMLIERLIQIGKTVQTRELPLDEFTKATSGDPIATTDEKRASAVVVLDEINEKYKEMTEITRRHHSGDLSEDHCRAKVEELSNAIAGDIENLELTARTLERFTDLFEKIQDYYANTRSSLNSKAQAMDIKPDVLREKAAKIEAGELKLEAAAKELDVPANILKEAVFIYRRERRIFKRLEESCFIPLDEFIARLKGIPKQWEIYNECKRLLIEANIRLVINIAKNYTNQGVDFLDLIQEGNAALIKAVERFDPIRGYKLGTYAIWWIRQAMLRTLAEQSHVVKLPTYLVQWIRRYSRISQELSQKLGREPTPQEISIEMEVEPDKSSKMRRFFTGQVSLNKSLGDDDSRTLEDVIADESSSSPLNMANLTMLQTELKRVLESLTPKEQRVITLRFGLEDNVPRTLEEIGQIFDLSRERIRQIEMKALSKLRHPNKLEKLLPYLKE
ncbi:MAG TPA: sigma-70 family RNA polymerase sigma factor [candidate division Zixibacteria bacterium]|nr:sigma-70 family RNA polymerase sigma factor [candidate division Zixibacteria bacterium]